MRMIAKYYTQITFDRMAELLDYSLDVSRSLRIISDFTKKRYKLLIKNVQ